MKLLSILIPLCLGGRGVSEDKSEENVSVTRDNAMKVGWNILFGQDGSENTVISPLSIIGAMYMLAAGTAGETQREILNALDFRDIPDKKTPFKAYSQMVRAIQNADKDSYILKLANGAFHQKDLPNGNSGKAALKQFSGILLEDFMQDLVNIKEVDFVQSPVESTDLINSWVNETTLGKIPTLFKEPLTEDTLMVLASSLYFRASWQNTFEVEKNNEGLCWQSSQDQMENSVCDEDVVFMSQTWSFKTYQSAGLVPEFRVIEIPMKDDVQGDVHNKFTMMVWIAEKFVGDDDDQDRRLRTFIRDNYADIRHKLHSGKRIKLSMPQFSLEAKTDLVEQMKSLGIETVFQSGNFTPMFGPDSPDCFVSQINHAVKLDVDTSGVEGAASTAIQISFRSGFDPTRFDVIRPFYFTISNRCWADKSRERCAYSNMPVFMGKVVNPATKK